MNSLPPKNREYIVNALAGVPVILHALLDGVGPDDPRWDAVVVEDRFTLREILAHLADFDPIFLDRIMRTYSENEPNLPDYDEGRLASEHDYAHKNPEESFAFFQTGRAQLIKLIEDLPAEAWTRVSRKDGVEWSLQAWVVQALAHDGYHLRQVAEWLRRL